jgi:feruloyl esterase
MFKFAVFEDPAWDYLTFDFRRDVATAEKKIAFLNATGANLKPFFARGGKLLHYHGWADAGIPPQTSVDYFRRAIKKSGELASSSYRLYMVPGMGHCRGGEGTDSFNMLAALEQWVEKKTPPAAIPAARVVDGRTVRTRPLCPYPHTAHYRGSGSSDDAANFACGVK